MPPAHHRLGGLLVGGLKTALPFLYMVIGGVLGYIVGGVVWLVATGWLRQFGIVGEIVSVILGFSAIGLVIVGGTMGYRKGKRDSLPPLNLVCGSCQRELETGTRFCPDCGRHGHGSLR